MEVKYQLLILCGIWFYLGNIQAKWMTCPGTKFPASIKKLVIGDCVVKEDLPCQLKKGTNAKVAVQFVAGEAATSVNASVHGIIAHIPVPFEVPNPAACLSSKETGIKCPTKTGQAYTYTNVIPVLKEYPAISVAVQWKLKDQKDEDLICFIVQVEIVN